MFLSHIDIFLPLFLSPFLSLKMKEGRKGGRQGGREEVKENSTLRTVIRAKDSLLKAQAHLRDLHIEASKAGQGNTNGTGKKGSDEPQMQSSSQKLTAGHRKERGKVRL